MISEQAPRRSAVRGVVVFCGMRVGGWDAGAWAASGDSAHRRAKRGGADGAAAVGTSGKKKSES